MARTLAYIDGTLGLSAERLLAAFVAAGLDCGPLNQVFARLGLELTIEAEIVDCRGVRGNKLWGKDGSGRFCMGDDRHPRPSLSTRRALELLQHTGLSPAAAARARGAIQFLAERALEAALRRDEFAALLGAGIAIDEFGIDRVVASPINLGPETTLDRDRASESALVLDLLRGVPIYSGEAPARTTPAGAALIRTLAQGFGPMPPLRPERLGHGADHDERLLRLIVGREEEAPVADSWPSPAPITAPAPALPDVILLEANCDDMSPEIFGYVLERALEAGALDVFGTPLYMKKNRPGLMISILAPGGERERLTQLLLSETTTLGVRSRPVERTILERDAVAVATAYGEIRLKIGRQGETVLNVAPEYEDCRAAARAHGVPLKEVYRAATHAWCEGPGKRS